MSTIAFLINSKIQTSSELFNSMINKKIKRLKYLELYSKH